MKDYDLDKDFAVFDAKTAAKTLGEMVNGKTGEPATEYIQTEEVSEVDLSDVSPMAWSILHRLKIVQPAVFGQYGLEKVVKAAEEVAERYQDWGEIGTSDVGHMVREVIRTLKDYGDQLNEFATGGATGAGSIASAPGGKKSSQVGTLFGGSYQQRNNPFKKKKKNG
jgi:hypothetical protein